MPRPFLRAIWAYLNEEGPGLLPFSSGPPQQGFWEFYRCEAAKTPRVSSEPDEPEAPDRDELPEYEPAPEPESDGPPTPEQVLSQMTIDHENKLSYLDMLPLDEDVREGLKNDAIDAYEQKVREWLA